MGSFFETRLFLERGDTCPVWKRVSSRCMMPFYAQLAACGGGGDKATEGTSVRRLRRAIGTFYLLAQKLSDLSKSTIVCKVGDLEVSPKSFWIWKHIHVHKEHVYEVYTQ
jgi:hypothetical protein